MYNLYRLIHLLQTLPEKERRQNILNKELRDLCVGVVNEISPNAIRPLKKSKRELSEKEYVYVHVHTDTSTRTQACACKHGFSYDDRRRAMITQMVVYAHMHTGAYIATTSSYIPSYQEVCTFGRQPKIFRCYDGLGVDAEGCVLLQPSTSSWYCACLRMPNQSMWYFYDLASVFRSCCMSTAQLSLQTNAAKQDLLKRRSADTKVVNCLSTTR